MRLLARPLCRAFRESGAHSRSQRNLRPRPQRRAELAVDRRAERRRDFFAAKQTQATADNVIRFYVTDAENSTSIVSAIGNARENARALRPLVSTEMWVALNVFHNRLKSIDPGELAPGNLNRLLTEIKEACQTFTGITEGTFYRDQAWYFFRLGRYIERADQTTRLLDTKYHLLAGGRGGAAPAEVGQWHALLRSASGYHAFRRIYSSRLTPALVAEF